MTLLNKLCVTHRPKWSSNHSVLPFKQVHVFDLGAILPSGQKLSAPFIWAEAERGTASGNRCSACLMLACGGRGPVWRHEAIVTPFWRRSNSKPPHPHQTPPYPFWWSSQVPKIHAALRWIKHLTQWLPDWWWDRRSHPRDARVWESPHLYAQLITRVNEKLCAKSATVTGLGLGCCCCYCGERAMALEAATLPLPLCLFMHLASDPHRVTGTERAGKCLLCLRAQTCDTEAWAS